ncbi:hypothetical protein ACLOJK_019824 [Asimina triloba]
MPAYACNSLCSLSSPYHTHQSSFPQKLHLALPSPNSLLPQNPNPIFPLPRTPIPRIAFFAPQTPFLKKIHTPFSSLDDRIEKTVKTQVPPNPERTNSKQTEVELLGKPSPPLQVDTSDKEEASQSPKPELDEALAPFLKFFKPRDSSEGEEGELEAEIGVSTSKDGAEEGEIDSERMVNVEYYEPKLGDLVVGVVVSGNESKLDVNVGADLLGTMLTKEVLPLYNEEISSISCDLRNVEEFMVAGKIGIVEDEEGMSVGESVSGRPVVEVGTILFAEVLGRTLSGRPLLSTRRMFRRVAWHRARQIKQLNEPIQVTISEWNTGGLLTRIEGLRAFLPKAELLNRTNNFTALKENIGRQIFVLITRIDEESNDLIISEKEAWEMLHLQEGTLLEGTIRKIFPYGAQVRIGDTNRSNLGVLNGEWLKLSVTAGARHWQLDVNVIKRTGKGYGCWMGERATQTDLHLDGFGALFTADACGCSRVTSVSDLLKEGEKVKVLVVKPMFAGKISLREFIFVHYPFLEYGQKVFSEAEEMARKYRQQLAVVSATRKLEALPTNVLPFDNEASSYANWGWFKFKRDN